MMLRYSPVRVTRAGLYSERGVMSTDWNAIFASLQVGKLHPRVKKMERSDQYSVLALYMHVHGIDCDADGWYQSSIRKLVADLFGYKASQVKTFVGGLVASGLFQANEFDDIRRRYRVLHNVDFEKLVAQYQDFVAETTKPKLPAGTPEGANLGGSVKGGQEHIVEALKQAEEDEFKANADHLADEPKGMSLAHLQNWVADHKVEDICAEVLDDPTVIRLIAEGLYARLHHLNNQ